MCRGPRERIFGDRQIWVEVPVGSNLASGIDTWACNNEAVQHPFQLEIVHEMHSASSLKIEMGSSTLVSALPQKSS